MDYSRKGSDILIKQPDFSLDETLDCGQAFRWTRLSDDSYEGFFLNRRLVISCEDARDCVFRLCGCTEDEFLSVWYDYFDLGCDYGEIKRRCCEDETLFKACSFAGGIRILRQDAWETLISFIISQNNNIPRIKGIINRLTERYGDGEGSEKFPEACELCEETVESLGFLRAGFRAKYIIDAARKVNDGTLDLKAAAELPVDEAREALMQVKGVGPKVADCTLLFGMYRTEAFPKDVWVKRVLSQWYPNGLPDCIKGIEGIAQQYLFHYIRNLK